MQAIYKNFAFCVLGSKQGLRLSPTRVAIWVGVRKMATLGHCSSWQTSPTTSPNPVAILRRWRENSQIVFSIGGRHSTTGQQSFPLPTAREAPAALDLAALGATRSRKVTAGDDTGTISCDSAVSRFVLFFLFTWLRFGSGFVLHGKGNMGIYTDPWFPSPDLASSAPSLADSPALAPSNLFVFHCRSE